jgi:hypothetical protein
LALLALFTGAGPPPAEKAARRITRDWQTASQRREAMMIPLFLQFMLAAFEIDPSIADTVVRTLSFLWRIIG